MKKTVLLLLLSIVCSIRVSAAFFSENGLYFQSTSETTAMVTFLDFPTGSTPNYYYTGNIVVPTTAYNAEERKTYSVTGIDELAFAYAPNLLSVVIPESIESIGENAFRSSKALTTITIPSSVKNIGSSSFLGCIGLTTVNLSEGLESIGYGCFMSCRKLNNITLPSTLKNLSEYAFNGCEVLEQIVIPEGITAIGEYTFQYCSKLKNITLPSTLTSIGQGAFFSLSALTDIAIPKQVNSIGKNAFSYCSNLTSIEIPEGVTELKDEAFTDCSKLAFVVLPSTLQTIGAFAFRGNSALRTITLPYGLNTIEKNAFMLSGLTSLELPETVSTIGDEAFLYVVSLSSVDIRSTNISIGTFAFQSCDALTQFTLASNNPDEIILGDLVFYFTPVENSTLTVPHSTQGLYAAKDPWNQFNIILEKQNTATASTFPANAITQASATLWGNITQGSEIITSKGFEYKKSTDPNWTTVFISDSELTTTLNSLTPYTLYEYKSFVTTTNGTVYGNGQMFKTLAIPPTATIGSATDITQTAASVSGNFTQGAETITGKGFVYKKETDSDWIILNVSGGTLAATLNGLAAYTSYECKAFVATVSGQFYSNILTFKTLATPPAVVTNTPVSITQTAATLKGTVTQGSETITEKGFVYKKSSDSNWITVVSASMSQTINSLTAYTQYEYKGYATTATGTVYGDVQTFKTLAIPPTVVTGSTTSIAQTTATLSGTITQGSEEITAQGFEYKKTSASTWTTLTVASGALTKALTGLTAFTSYSYRAFATTVSGTVYGSTQTFTTLANPPTVTTGSATSITQTAATLAGTAAAGSEPITEKGFAYKKVADSNWINVPSSSMTQTISSLSASTQYEYRAYATTASGTTYGTTRNFTTLAIAPTVTTNAATSIAQTSATLSGAVTAGSETITEQGFAYKKVADSNWTTIVSASMLQTVNALSANTQYEYKAYATTAAGTVYGSVKTFTTLDIVSLTITTNAAASVTQTSATLSGTVTVGSETITEQGFAYKKTVDSNWSTIVSGLMSQTISGLNPYTQYEYKGYAVTASGTVYGNVQTFMTLAIAPTVMTNAATSVTQTSATLSGTVVTGSETITEQGFAYKKASDSNWATATSMSMNQTVSSLAAYTQYEYKAYAITASGTVYGSVKTFTTLAIAPTVTTNGTAAITQTSATLLGVVAQGSEVITEQGFAYKKATDVNWTTIVSASMSQLINSLTAYTQYEYKAYAVTASGTVYGATKNFTTLPIAPTVTTNDAGSITQTTATLSGSVTQGSEAVTEKGFVYKKTSDSNWTTIASGIMNQTISSLTAYTQYEYKGYAVTASGTVYGSVKTFTTLAIAPAVTTHAAISVAQTTAILSGAITAGSEAITEQGFAYKKVSESNWTTVTSGTMSQTVSGLSANTLYEYKAYAITAGGTVYGSVQSFTTLPAPPAVTVNPATSITQTTVTLSGTVTQGSETIISKGFAYKKTVDTDWITVVIPDGILITNLTNLIANTSYDYKAFATTVSGTVSSNTASFQTLVIGQTVITNAATSVTRTSATLSGTIMQGSETIVSKGFAYKKTTDINWTTITIDSEPLTTTINGLSEYTLYEYKAYATTTGGTVYGNVQNFKTLAIPPTVTTNAATLVVQTSATFSGTITQGSETITEQGFAYKKVSDSNWSIITSVSMSEVISGLAAYTQYEYKAYAVTTGGTVYGIVQNFTTLAILPTVTTNAATSVTQTSATLSGSITQGSETITEKGFMYKKVNDLSWTTIVSSTMSQIISGLTAYTQYEYKAYAVTAGGIAYGIVQNFTTLAIAPTVTTHAAASVTQTSATLSGSVTQGSEAITEQGFAYKKVNDSNWSILTSASMSETISGLAAYTSYEYKGYAVTAGGTAYGIVQNFTTLAIAPVAITNTATSITQTSATLSGSTIQGSEVITERGFVYKRTSDSNWTTVVSAMMIHAITTLNPYTQYEYKSYVITAGGTVYGNIQQFTTLAIAPTVTTGAAASVTQTSVTFSGTVTQGSETITEQGFAYKKIADANWTTVTSATMNQTITGLTPYTQYEYKSYIITAGGTVYGIVQPFTTLAFAPVVTAHAAELVTQTSATLSGSITQGSEPIILQGFYYKMISDTNWNTVTSAGALTVSLADLAANTLYEYKAFVITMNSMVYSNVLSFQTLAVAQTVTTNPATSITQTSATLSGTVIPGSNPVTSQGFAYKKATETDWIAIAAGSGSLTVNLTGLSLYTLYEYKAYATTIGGTVYGNVQTFTTLGIAPVVKANAATSITQTTASVSATVTLGSEPVVSQGFLYKKSAESNWDMLTLAELNTTLAELTANTSYDFKAFVVTQNTTVYSPVLKFETLATPPTVVTNAAASVTHNSVILSGSTVQGSEQIFFKGFDYKKTNETNWTSVLAPDEGLTVILNGLDPYTQYEYKAYAITNSKITYGNVQTFTTLFLSGLPIAEVIERTISLYPNPATTVVNIHAEGINAGTMSIEITDLQGRLLDQVKGETSVDVSRYSKGAYLVRIFDGGKLISQNKKLIVK